jgi:hypothetical protein
MSGTATAGARPRNSLDVRSEGETKRGADRRAARLRDFSSAIARAANLRRVVGSVVYPQSRVPSSDRARRATAVMHAAHASSGLGLGHGLGLGARASAFAGASSRPDPSARPSSTRRAATVVVTPRAAKGRNARLAGRDKKAQRREDDKMLDGVEAKAAALKESKAAKRAAKEAKADAPKRDPTLKYSKRGKVSSQPGQVSKAALRRVREATAAKQAEGAISAERAAEKREEYRKAQGQGIPQVVTDRMLKRITIFSGVPLLMGFATGPAFYGLKVIAKVDVAPWQFFFASTATFGGALLGITYGVLSASWEPGREGTFWGLEEFKANIPILIQTVTGKAAGQDGSEFPDEWDDGEP